MNRFLSYRARVLLLLLGFLCAAPSLGEAATRRARRSSRTATARRAPVRRARQPVRVQYGSYASALVIEADSGVILYQKNPDAPRVPASITKMMTELIALEAVDRGLISLDDVVTVPAEVRSVGGSRVRLRPGEKLPFRELLRAMAIASANDAAVAVADKVAGTQEAFIGLMNLRARELGMTHTRYYNVHGLDKHGQPGNITTARDLAILAREVLKHPLALAISSTPFDVIRGNQVIRTTNRLLGRYPGVDGLKTGYTSGAGFCLVSTARREEMRVISILLGAPSNARRFSETANLLDQAFAGYHRVNVIRKGQDLGYACATLGGSPPQVRLVAGDDVAIFLPASMRGDDIRLRVEAPASIPPPVEEGMVLGRLQVMVGDSIAAVAPAVAAREVRRASLLDRFGLHSERIE